MAVRAGGDPEVDDWLVRFGLPPLTVVEKRFKAVDSNNDGKLTEKELRSYPGRALLRLLQQ